MSQDWMNPAEAARTLQIPYSRIYELVRKRILWPVTSHPITGTLKIPKQTIAAFQAKYPTREHWWHR